MWCESSLYESNVAVRRLIGVACFTAALIEAIAKCLCDLRVVISSTKSGTKLSRELVNPPSSICLKDDWQRWRCPIPVSCTRLKESIQIE